MFKVLIEKKGFTTRKKKDAYNLIVINRNPLPSGKRKVNKEIKLLLIVI